MTYDFGVTALVAALEKRDILAPEEKQALYALGWRVRDFQRSAEIVPDRSSPSECCLIASGVASRSVVMCNGTRQLAALHLQGDFVDLHGMLAQPLDHSVVALSNCRVAFCQHAAIQRLSESQPHLFRMLLMLIGVDAAIQRNWMVGLGRRNPVSQFAHLLCELYVRYKIIGAVKNQSYELAIGQVELADMLGLSVVHTNRTVQELRSSGTMSWKRGRVHIHDWTGLARLAEFDAAYLGLAPVHPLS